MIDLRTLRDDPGYRERIERKRVGPGLIAEVLALDAEQRAQQQAVEALRTRQKAVSKEVGKAAPDERPARQAEAAEAKRELQAAESELAVLDARLRELALTVPNPADPEVPDGGEDDGQCFVSKVRPAPRRPWITRHSQRRWASSKPPTRSR